MKKKIAIVAAVIMMGAAVLMPGKVQAAGCPDGYVQTSILGSSTDKDGKAYKDAKGNKIRCMKTGDDGEGIFDILNIVLTVMTFGVGILATIGIVLSGYQYITAKDDASKVQKAKDRLLQIVIGLAVYALMWGVLQFLLPGGLFGNGN